jgi:hypothetical protein
MRLLCIWQRYTATSKELSRLPERHQTKAPLSKFFARLIPILFGLNLPDTKTEMNPSEVFDTTFNANTERQNQLSVEPLKCMQQIPEPHPLRAVLTPEQTAQAKADLLRTAYVVAYPRAATFQVDDPVPQQRLGLISFIPAKGATPDSQGSYGVVKVRGNYSTLNEASAQAERIIRDRDSLVDIDVAYVGRWYPLMSDNSAYTAVTQEIDIRTTVVDETVQSHLRDKRRKEEKEMREVRERSERLTDLTHQEEKATALDNLELYTQLRVKYANALQAIDEYKLRIQQAEIVMTATLKEIKKMDSEFPDYKDAYLERYTNGLNAIGAELAQNPLLKYMGQALPEEEKIQ